MLWIPEDKDEISEEFQGAVQFAKNANILISTGGLLHPKQEITLKEALLSLAASKKIGLGTDEAKMTFLKNMGLESMKEGVDQNKKITR